MISTYVNKKLTNIKPIFSQKEIRIISSIVLLFSGLYFIIVFDSINKYNIINYFLYLISLVIVLFSINSIKKNNINSYNIFLLFFFGALFLNTINLSEKQFLKTSLDLYYILIAPLILFIFLYVVENIQIKKIKLKSIKIHVDTFYIILLISYIFLKTYIGLKMGFKIEDYSDISKIVSGTDYVIPGISGISVIIQWALVMLIPFVKKRYSVIGIISIIVFSGILNVKRGDIIRVLLFLIFYSVYMKIYFKQLDLKNSMKGVIGISLFFTIFIMFGEYRMEARGAEPGLIIEFLGSRIDSVSISWLYSYFAFNFEILQLHYADVPSYEMVHLSELFGSNLSRESIGLETTISGFNAGTFIQPFIQDYGMLYFFEIILFSIILSILVYVSKKLDFIGLYIFILMLMSLLIFGDYIINRAMMMSLFSMVFIFPFLKIPNNRKKLI